jgi:hypothetical protein
MVDFRLMARPQAANPRRAKHGKSMAEEWQPAQRRGNQGFVSTEYTA